MTERMYEMKNVNRILNWLDKKTKRVENLYAKIVFAVCIPSFIALFALLVNKDHISENIYNILIEVIPLTIVLAIYILPLLIFIRMLIAVKNGMHNVRKCDDELFDKIDFFLDYWRNEDATCKKRISIINLYYKDGGKIDELVQNKEIVRLFARKSFLSVRINFTQDIMTCFYSLIISVIASTVFQLIQSNGFFTMLFEFILVLIMFFILLFIRYYKRGENGSYTYQIQEYELKLLSEKIEKLESGLQANEQDEKILVTQQTILKDLINKKRRLKSKKSQKSLIKDIETLETLDLSLEYCDNYKLYEISFDKNTGYMAYSLDENGEINGLPTEPFKIFYEIIKKHYRIIENTNDTVVCNK